MPRTLFAWISAILLTSAALPAQTEKPGPAQDILNASLKESTASHRPVFLIFHASWCSWCHRLENAMESPELRAIFKDHFVVTRLDVMESDKGKIDSLENPGGRDIMARLGGEKAGLPFYAFLDSTGTMLCNSIAMPGDNNIGYPATTEEIATFGKLLERSAPAMSGNDRETILAYLTAHAPHRNP